MIRNILRENIFISAVLALIMLGIFYAIYKYMLNFFTSEEKKIVIFGVLFFIVSLLPFLGLGNITERYSYLATFGLLLLFGVLLNKAYVHLFVYGKDIAIASLAIFLFVFSLFHIIQVQKLHGDWRGAGDMVERFFISVDAQYDNVWSDGNVELHFVNVPIKHGDAWVFPVGLEDALFISFRNPDLHIFKHATVDQAKDIIGSELDNKIFEFQPDGSILEIPKSVGKK